MSVDASLPLDSALLRRLQCPVCASSVYEDPCGGLVCEGTACGARFPVVHGIPVMLNEADSAFTVADVLRQFSAPRPERLERAGRWLLSLLPQLGRNSIGPANYARLARLLMARCSSPLVLVLGGRIEGKGSGALRAFPAIRLVETDIAPGSRTALICGRARRSVYG